jgi:hypothetical protein
VIEVLRQPIESALTAGVVVVDELAGGHRVSVVVALPGRHPDWDQDEVGDLGGRGVPGHDLLGVAVDDERDIDEPGPGPDVGEVRDPDPVRLGRGERAVEQVPGPGRGGVGDGGAGLLPAPDTVHPEVAHEPVDGAVRDRQPAPVHQRDHLAPPVEAIGSPDGGQ